MRSRQYRRANDTSPAALVRTDSVEFWRFASQARRRFRPCRSPGPMVTSRARVCVCARAHTHTHTHLYIYVYVYVYICPKSPGPDGCYHTCARAPAHPCVHLRYGVRETHHPRGFRQSLRLRASGVSGPASPGAGVTRRARVRRRGSTTLRLRRRASRCSAATPSR